LGVGVVLLTGAPHTPQWLFNAPFVADKYADVCGERDSISGICTKISYSVARYDDATYLRRFVKVHEALAAKLRGYNDIRSPLQQLYVHVCTGVKDKNTPIATGPETDFVWSGGVTTTTTNNATLQFSACNTGVSAFPRNVSLDAHWCPSGDKGGIRVAWRPMFEQFSHVLIQHLQDKVYKELREKHGLHLMVTRNLPTTFVNFEVSTETGVQTKKHMEDAELFEANWLLEHVPGSWVSRYNEGAGYNSAGERTRVAGAVDIIHQVVAGRAVRSRGALSAHACWTGRKGSHGHFGTGPVASTCLLQKWHLYAMALHVLTIKLDYWNVAVSAAGDQLEDPANLGLWQFLNRYSGVRWGWQSPGAWIGFREGLDMLDSDRFPQDTYGALPHRWRTMSKNALQSHENHHKLLSRARTICASLTAQGCMMELDALSMEPAVETNGTNDVGMDVWRSDYGMFMRRTSSDESIGWWWQGPTEQRYGRYARGFAHPTATIGLTLDKGLWSGLPLVEARQLTLRLVFLDEGEGSFYLGYDSLGGSQGWTIKKSGSGRWKELVRVITDGRFAGIDGTRTDGADVWLSSMSACNSWEDNSCVERPTLFDSIEVVEVPEGQSVLIGSDDEFF
jgi:hypothetical protein